MTFEKYDANIDVVFDWKWIRPKLGIHRVWYVVGFILLFNFVFVAQDVFRLLYTLDGTISTDLGSLCVFDAMLAILLTARYPPVHRFLRWAVHDVFAPATVLKGAATFAGFLHCIIMLSSGYTNLDLFGPVSTGILLMVFMFVGMGHAAAFWANWYRLFYHIPSYVFGVILVAFGITHFVEVQSWFSVSVAGFAVIIESSHLVLAWKSWFYDWRATANRRFNRANITHMRLLPGHVVEVQLSWKQQYKAGQFVYVCIPVLNGTTWHPFSLSTSPYKRVQVSQFMQAPTTTFHARVIGEWTYMLEEECQAIRQNAIRDEEVRLAKLAVQLPGAPQAKLEPVSIEYPKVYLDGPHGELCPADLAPYQAFLFISGGIGVTPLQAIYNQLLFDRQKDTKYMTCFAWAVAEKDEIIQRGINKNVTIDEMRYMHYQPNLIDWKLVEALNPSLHQLRFFLSRQRYLNNIEFAQRREEANPVAKKFPAPSHLEFRNTSQLVIEDYIDTFYADCVRQCVQKAIVFVCGPVSLSLDVRNAVKKLDLEETELEVRQEDFHL